MAWFTAARTAYPIVAMGIVAVAAAACNPVQAPVAVSGQGAAQYGVNAADSYSCYFADAGGGDRVIAGRALHWCGPVPRAVQ
jgi:hypothetical protein